MKAHVLGDDNIPTEQVDASPQCGEDFCDMCGDCLRCNWEDPCYRTDSGEHLWVVYSEDSEEFRQRMASGS